MELVEGDGVLLRVDSTVEEFVLEAAQHHCQEGFWEREVICRMEQYSNIAHIFSTYESRVGDTESDPVARGIKSVQVLCHGKR